MNTKSRQEALTALSAALDRAGDLLEELSPSAFRRPEVYWRLESLITEAANLAAGSREYKQERKGVSS
jgi:hypothetical protein